MADILRLKRYTTYLDDGRSSVSYVSESKSRVVIAVVVGSEPSVLKKSSDALNVDDVILKLAAHIKKCRANRKAVKRE